MIATTAPVAAWVAGEPVPVEVIEGRLAQVRRSGFGVRLPGERSAEGRNARRWVTQLVCAERVVRAELAARGIAVSGRRERLHLDRVLSTGGVAAAVQAAVPECAALVAAVTPEADAVRRYYDANPDLFAERAVSLEQAAPAIERELGDAAADRAFAAWLDARMAADVVLAHGFEHPADPSHADATHHH